MEVGSSRMSGNANKSNISFNNGSNETRNKRKSTEIRSTTDEEAVLSDINGNYSGSQDSIWETVEKKVKKKKANKTNPPITRSHAEKTSLRKYHGNVK